MKTIIITGGATGIGKATCEKFLQEGYQVGFCDCNKELGLSCLKDLQAKFGEDLVNKQVHFAVADVRNREQLQSFVQECKNKFEKISALFVNAGIHRSNTLLNISDEELKDMIDINLYGSIYTMQVVVPFLIENQGGSIVINDSDQFFIGKANNFAYGLTKGALGQMTRSLSIDLGQHKIRVNAVCGGTIRTPLADQALERYAKRANLSLEEAWQEENSLFARGSAGTAEEVAEMVFFLTDKADFCTGGHYLIDGGLVAR